MVRLMRYHEVSTLSYCPCCGCDSEKYMIMELDPVLHGGWTLVVWWHLDPLKCCHRVLHINYSVRFRL